MYLGDDRGQRRAQARNSTSITSKRYERKKKEKNTTKEQALETVLFMQFFTYGYYFS
jgi:hypothetical protein